MRLWSIHPKYLDKIGLVALWREALLAKKVLENKTKGYKNHPQLERFKNIKNPIIAINQYLSYIIEEAKKRNYNFDKNKIQRPTLPTSGVTTNGQIEYEFSHLLKKLKIRDPKKYTLIKNTKKIEASPFFKIKNGEIEKWEKIKP